MRLIRILQYLLQILAFVIIFLPAGLHLPPVCLHFVHIRFSPDSCDRVSPSHLDRARLESAAPEKELPFAPTAGA